MATHLRTLSLCLVSALATLLAGCDDPGLSQSVVVGPTDADWPPTDAAVPDVPPPVRLALDNLAPAHGPFTGGTEVTLRGAGFDDSTTVTIGKVALPAADVTLVSPQSLTVVTPAGGPGPADVALIRGDESVTQPDAFHYDALAVTPPSGPAVGGTFITVKTQGAAFTDATHFTLAGEPLVDPVRVDANTVEAFTPPGAQGLADLVATTPGQPPVTVQGAYSYYPSFNANGGGLGGGPIQGTLTVAVLDAGSLQPIDGASVLIEQDGQLLSEQRTDPSGVVVLAQKGLAGPLTVTAGRKGDADQGLDPYQSGTFLDVDARDLTILLRPMTIKMQSGPLPPTSLVRGRVFFGGPAGFGTEDWHLVPTPGPGQKKRTYLYITTPSLDQGISPRKFTIDHDSKSKQTAFPFEFKAPPGPTGIFAMAGLYHEESEVFTPYALGLTRVAVTAGVATVADVLVDLPLDRTVQVELQDVPPEMTRYRALVAVDLGADGLICPQEWTTPLAATDNPVALQHMPSLTALSLAAAGLVAEVVLVPDDPATVPWVKGRVRGRPWSGSLVVDRFVGPPRVLRPASPGALLDRTVSWAGTGAPHNLSVITLKSPTAFWMLPPMWVIVAPGQASEITLVDPAAHNLLPLPATVRWRQQDAHIPSFDYNRLTYLHLLNKNWDRWSYDQASFEVP